MQFGIGAMLLAIGLSLSIGFVAGYISLLVVVSIGSKYVKKNIIVP